MCNLNHTQDIKKYEYNKINIYNVCQILFQNFGTIGNTMIT